MSERKGFFTPEQEQILDDLYEGKGLIEAVDGVAIRLMDNQGLERLKVKLPDEALPIVYEVIDEIFAVLESITNPEGE